MIFPFLVWNHLPAPSLRQAGERHEQAWFGCGFRPLCFAFRRLPARLGAICYSQRRIIGKGGIIALSAVSGMLFPLRVQAALFRIKAAPGAGGSDMLLPKTHYR
ncbi:MAG: hypothetical protein B0D92_04850 [Spirochaeta sp. LUC14_002_19_P3]|nr:MAG: hypothetical protein B0D92_04850 [Spirochaeta sp. LUC14_002_19_P3]